MPQVPRAVLAVFAGWAFVVALALATDSLLMKLYPREYIQGQMPPAWLAALSLTTSAFWCIAGGWLCCYISRGFPWRHAAALALWGVAIAGISTYLAWGRIQPWYQIGILLLWPAAVFTGAWLRSRQLRRA